MAESIIGKNLDNITNVAKGIDKEFLDMTYPDKYYRDVINPAKLGKAPIPSKMEMIGQSIKSFGPVKAMFIGAQRGKYGERAMPTKPAQKFLDTLGSAAKFGIKRVAPVLSIFAPTEMGAAEITPEMRQSLEMGIPNTKNFQNMDTRGIMNPELLDKFDRSPASSGVRQTIGSRIMEGLGSIRDTVTDKLGSVGDFIKGGGILGQALKGLGNMFEYRGGIGYVDEDGIFRSADELDKLNALGGYYTDAARASRRRDASIQRMLQRRAEGKRIGEQRLKDLLEQQAKEEAARQAAARAMQDANRANRTGGYQSSFASDTDFMEGDPNAGGRATTATMGST